MDKFDFYDPRYQLEAEDFAAAPTPLAASRSIHQGILQAMQALDALAERLRQRAHTGHPPHH